MSSRWSPAIPGCGGGPSRKPERRERADLLLRVVGPELGAEREREHLHQPPVALAAGDGGRLEEARGAEDGRAALAPSRRQRAQQPRSGGRGRSRHALRQADRGVPLVPGERLVAAVADERDRHLAPRRLADEEERQRRLVAERLVECGRQPRQRRSGVRLEDDLLVPRRVALRHRARERPLVVAVVREPDGERAHRLRRRRGHERDDDGRVDPAGEERAERDVGREALPHRVGDGLPHPLQPGAVLERLVGGPRLPVALDPLRPALRHEQRGGREAVDAAQAGAVAGDVLEREIRVERGEVRLAAQPRQRRAAPSAPTRTRASRRRGASRRAASCRAGRARARAGRAAHPRARSRTSPRAARRSAGRTPRTGAG